MRSDLDTAPSGRYYSYYSYRSYHMAVACLFYEPCPDAARAEATHLEPGVHVAP